MRLGTEFEMMLNAVSEPGTLLYEITVTRTDGAIAENHQAGLAIVPLQSSA
jgi:hypothetical protein